MTSHSNDGATPDNPLSEAVAYAIEQELVGPPSLAELYEQYMAALEAQIEAEAVFVTADNALCQTAEYQAKEAAAQEWAAAKRAANDTLAAIKEAVGAEFLATGDRQPHPYAGVQRIDRRPRYNDYVALRWLKARPDYRDLVVPESVNRRGFEKLARALDGAGMPPCYEDDGIDIPVVEWDDIPVVAVRMRPDDV